MNPFKSVVPSRCAPLSSALCEDVISKFKIDDVRSDVITSGSALLWQFWAHWTMNSVGVDNLYRGQTDGWHGSYPTVGMGSVLMKDGYFKLGEDSLPRMRSDVDADDMTEMTPDNHRANENPVLKAFHLLLAKAHNLHMGQLNDFEAARDKTVGLFNRLFLNEALLVTGMDEHDFFAVRIPNFHMALEFNFAVARWAHAQMPDTTNGKPIFRRHLAVEVDMVALFDGSEMARDLNLGVSTAMTQMSHVGGEADIRRRTLGRTLDMGLANYGELARSVRETPLAGYEDWPMWPGILIEAETQGDGLLGPVGARAVADGLAGSMLWARGEGKGVWYSSADLPQTTPDIIAYMAAI